MIIDSHLHLSITSGEKDFTEVKDKLLKEMDENEIDKAIVIPDNLHNSLCSDLDTTEKLIKDNQRFLMVATLKIDEINRDNLEKVEHLFAEKKAIGFKIFPGHDPVYPTDEEWLPVINLCVGYNFPLIIHTGINVGNKEVAKYNDPKYIVQLAKENPRLKIIICHYFWPKLEYCFETVKNFTNIYFDTSALADEDVIKECGGIEKIKEILEKTMKNRQDSLIFGTDWPIGNIKKHKDLIESLNVSQNQKEMIFSDNAISVFGIKK